MKRSISASLRRRRWSILALAVVLAAVPCLAATPEGPSVRSGCEIDYPPYCLVTPEGRAEGFSVELLRAALRAVGKDVTFETGEWETIKNGLAEGRIQALPLVGRTPERERLFDFTFPYLGMHGTVVVRRGDRRIRSVADLRGMEVAVLKGDNAEEYLRRSDLGARIVPLPSFAAALRELSAGRHDAVVVQKLVAFQIMKANRIENLESVGPPIQEFAQQLCFAVRNGDRKLLSSLNEGLSIVMADGTFRELYARWFADLEAMGRAKSRVVVGGDANYPPYEFLDGNARPAGFNVDLTRAIAKRQGLEVEIVLGPWAKIRQGLERGEIDVVQGMFYSPERGRAFSFSPPHAIVRHAIVVRSDQRTPGELTELADRDVVVMEADLMHDVALAAGAGKPLAAVGSQEEALRLLVSGRHDAALVAALPASFWIDRHRWKNLSVSAGSIRDAEYCYAVPHGREDLLAPFVEGMSALKASGEFREIRDRWLGPYEPSGHAWALRAGLLGFAALLVLLAGIVAWNRSLRRQVGERTRELSEKAALLEARSESLRKSEDDFRYVFEHSVVGMSITSIGGEVRVNEAFAGFLGYAVGEMVGFHWRRVTHPGDLEETQRQMDALLSGERKSVRFLKRFLRRDGEVVWADTSSAIRRDAEGRPMYFMTTILDVTERVRAQEALRESESLLSRFIALSPIHAYIKLVTPLESRVLHASDSFRAMIGRPGSEIVGRTMAELFPQEFAEKITADDWSVVENGEVLALDEDFGGRSYTTIKFPIVLGDRRLLAGYTIDMTERKLLEREALEAERRFQLLAEATSEGVVIAEDGTLLDCNGRFATIFGYEKGEVVGMPIVSFLSPESAARYRRRIVTGQTDRWETTARRKDGSLFPIAAEAGIVQLQGRAVRITAIRDLSEQRKAEADVERLTRLYAALIEVNELIGRALSTRELFREVPRILVETGGFQMAWIGMRDVASTMVLAVGSHGDATGYLDGIRIVVDETPEGMGPMGTAIREGRPSICNDFLHDPGTLPWREKARRAGWRAAAAFPFRRGDETVGALTVYALEPFVFGSREVALFEEAATDLSVGLGRLESEIARRKAEEELRQLNADLESRILERTAQLEEANAELEAFSYSVSHDLRAPLRAIDGFSALLVREQGGRLDEEGRRRLDTVRKSTARMSTLIDDLLRLSRVGRAEMRRERVAMEDLVRGVFEELLPAAEARDRIAFQVKPLPAAIGDVALLRQVWVNLLSNALKYSSRQERPEIVVEGGLEGEEAVYRVRDNGVGFDMRYVEKLFGVFQRLHAQDEFEGTGVGLALVKRIVTRHGGRVRAESTPGEGSTFSFSLPPG